jgi:fructokinase
MDLVNNLLKIAEQNPKGFTVYLNDLKPVSSGWVVALLETQNSHGTDGLKRVIEVSKEKTGVVGGWSEDGKFWWDAVQIFEDEKQATEFGIANKQIAIYHIETNFVKFL